MEKRRKTLRESYFDWLYKQIDGHRRSYIKLCRILYDKKFRWSVALDDNRCEDGLDLRRQFADGMDETHLEVQYFLKGDCTVFEMMVALAIRMNDQIYDLNSQENKTPKLFQELLGNLGMLHFYDALHLSVTDEVRIDQILEILMDRTYGRDGSGSLFPLKRRPPKDMSRVEIWYQMMAYLNENYGM